VASPGTAKILEDLSTNHGPSRGKVAKKKTAKGKEDGNEVSPNAEKKKKTGWDALVLNHRDLRVQEKGAKEQGKKGPKGGKKTFR